MEKKKNRLDSGGFDYMSIRDGKDIFGISVCRLELSPKIS